MEMGNSVLEAPTTRHESTQSECRGGRRRRRCESRGNGHEFNLAPEIAAEANAIRWPSPATHSASEPWVPPRNVC